MGKRQGQGVAQCKQGAALLPAQHTKRLLLWTGKHPSRTVFVPTTNFAFFHAGQPKVIHDYWGQAFVKDCPFGGMGWEFRPTFLWPRSQPDDNESAPHVSFEGANRFIIDLLANLTLKYGQRLDSKNFASTPLLLSQTALPLWNKFRHCAEASKDDVPEFAAGAVGKYCFTTTSHIMACHLLEQSFLDTKDGNLSMLRSYDVTALETTAAAPMPVSMSEMPAELILAAPSHLDLMLAGVLTCFNEMKLPPAQRAGPPRLDENRCQPNRRPNGSPPEAVAPLPLSSDEVALSMLLQRYEHAEYITVTNVNQTLPRKLKFPSHQQAICRIFDVATQHMAGVREGARQSNLRLRLTLSQMQPEFRRHLNLHLSTPCRHSLTVPSMNGSGKRGRMDSAPPLQPPARRMRGKAAPAEPAQAQAPPPEILEEEEAVPAKKWERSILVDPIFVPVHPVTAKAAEDGLNCALTILPHVHGQPFKIKATPVARKQGTVFQLRCDSCKHHTCTWRGIAKMDEDSMMLKSWFMSNNAHGQPRTPTKSGRKGQDNERVFSVREVLKYNGGLDHPSIAQTIMDHFKHLPLRQSLLVSCRPRKPTKKGLTCVFYCQTHWNKNSGEKCCWGGAAQVSASAEDGHEIHLRYQDPSKHAPHEVELYGTLTWQQRQAAERNAEEPMDLQAVESLQDTPNPNGPPQPSKQGLVADFVKQLRKKRLAKAREAPFAPGPHTARDFQYCRDASNASLGRGQRELLPGSPDLLAGDACLRVVDMRLSAENVCVPLICPALLQQTFDLLPKPWNLKVSTDGTYRLMFENYALLTLGVNVKNWSARKDLNIFSFRSSFVPLCFALANKENDKAYTHMGITLLNTAQALGIDVQPHHILQWHGDMHLGIAAARRTLAPTSKRLTDWAHVTGATSQGPAGFAGLIAKELPQPLHSTLLPWLLQICRISKQWTLCLFHVLWQAVFSDLEGRGHEGLAKKLQKQYFHSTDLEGEEVWDAPWRSAPDRIMPGTDAGSALQESWHGNTLKPIFGQIRRKPAEVAKMIENRIVRPQLQVLAAMKNEGRTFQDWPAIGQFMDQHILTNELALKKEGRTSSQSLLAWGQHQRHKDSEGNIWILVPTSKFKRDWSQSNAKKRVFKDRNLATLPPDAAKCFAAIVTAAASSQVKTALSDLGLYDANADGFLCWKATAKMFDDWRCVVAGPFARRLWQSHGSSESESAVREDNSHALWLCFGCHTASLSGPCEHAYCCMQHEGHFLSTALPKPKPKGRPQKHRKKDKQSYPAQILPGQPSSPLSPSTLQPLLQPSSLDHELRALLRTASLGHLFEAMSAQGVTLSVLRRFSFSDFHAFFKMTLSESNALMDALETATTLADIAAE